MPSQFMTAVFKDIKVNITAKSLYAYDIERNEVCK